MPNRIPRILIADDEEDYRKLLIMHLYAADARMNSVRAVEAVDGTDALRKYTVAQAIGDPFDLVILDGVMPEKNGFQVAEEIRAEDDETKIAFLTADHSGVAPMRASLIQASAFWRKPLDITQVAREAMDLIRCE